MVGEAVIVLRLVPRVVRAEVVVLKVVLLALVTQVVTHPLKVTLVDLKVETIFLVVVAVRAPLLQTVRVQQVWHHPLLVLQ